MRKFVLLILIGLAFATGPAGAQKAGQPPGDLLAGGERILSFDSEIEVTRDGSVLVTETIRVVATGQQIRRGIFRDLPTDYDLGWGGTRRVDLDILLVERNGRSEPWHTEGRANGTRIFIGDGDRYVRHGQHTYRLKYRMSRIVGFFTGHDEIYWNVTGNDWAFPIEQARAIVRLPDGTRILQSAAWTGRQGARGSDLRIVRAAGPWEAETLRPLRHGEGFTVAVGFEKGHVTAPGALLGIAYLIDDYRLPLVALLGLAGLFLYYFITWIRVGRDPRGGTIIPRFYPPTGLSPAACRFVVEMGYDQKAFAAALIGMAVKGFVEIREKGRGRKPVYEIVKRENADRSRLSPGERAIAEALFRNSDRIELKQKNHSRIRKAISALTESLKTEYEKGMFLLNRGQFYWGLGISVLVLVLAALAGNNMGFGLFFGVWILIWGIGCVFLVRSVVVSWRAGHKARTILLAAVSVPFLSGLVAGGTAMAEATSYIALGMMAGIVALNVVFFSLLKAPTRDGRKVMDEIEGFRMYLAVAEKDRLEALHPPERTPELFERYLPYAFALGVAQQWSEQFAGILDRAGQGGDTYRPYWYVGNRGWSGDVGGFADSLASGFSGAIAASSTAPGSSSGSGGGGSSGGGGGGGGGGGW